METAQTMSLGLNSIQITFYILPYLLALWLNQYKTAEEHWRILLSELPLGVSVANRHHPYDNACASRAYDRARPKYSWNSKMRDLDDIHDLLDDELVSGFSDQVIGNVPRHKTVMVHFIKEADLRVCQQPPSREFIPGLIGNIMVMETTTNNWNRPGDDNTAATTLGRACVKEQYFMYMNNLGRHGIALPIKSHENIEISRIFDPDGVNFHIGLIDEGETFDRHVMDVTHEQYRATCEPLGIKW